MNKTAKLKPKRRDPAKPKPLVQGASIASNDIPKARKPKRNLTGLAIGKFPGAENSICPDGTVEFRNEQIILHEPLASRVQGIKRLTGMAYKQMLRRAFELLEEQLDAEDAAKRNRAKRKPKAQGRRKKRTRELPLS